MHAQSLQFLGAKLGKRSLIIIHLKFVRYNLFTLMLSLLDLTGINNASHPSSNALNISFESYLKSSVGQWLYLTTEAIKSVTCNNT